MDKWEGSHTDVLIWRLGMKLSNGFGNSIVLQHVSSTDHESGVDGF